MNKRVKKRLIITAAIVIPILVVGALLFDTYRQGIGIIGQRTSATAALDEAMAALRDVPHVAAAEYDFNQLAFFPTVTLSVEFAAESIEGDWTAAAELLAATSGDDALADIPITAELRLDSARVIYPPQRLATTDIVAELGAYNSLTELTGSRLDLHMTARSETYQRRFSSDDPNVTRSIAAQYDAVRELTNTTSAKHTEWFLRGVNSYDDFPSADALRLLLEFPDDRLLQAYSSDDPQVMEWPLGAILMGGREYPDLQIYFEAQPSDSAWPEIEAAARRVLDSGIAGMRFSVLWRDGENLGEAHVQVASECEGTRNLTQGDRDLGDRLTASGIRVTDDQLGLCIPEGFRPPT